MKSFSFQPPCAIFSYIIYSSTGCQLSDIAVDSRLLFVVGVAGSSADCRLSGVANIGCCCFLIVGCQLLDVAC
jgi:hypothetical protein